MNNPIEKFLLEIRLIIEDLWQMLKDKFDER